MEVPCTQSCFDILCMIKHQIKKKPVTFIPQDVDGRQDKKKKYENLDKWGIASVRADKVAKKYMNLHPTTIPNVTVEPKGSGWLLSRDGKRIVANTNRELYDHCTESDIKNRDHSNSCGTQLLYFKFIGATNVQQCQSV